MPRKGEFSTPQQIIDRHTMPIPECGCWIWLGSLGSGGYGLVGFKKRNTSQVAHRFVYESIKGPIPEGLELDHKCRVRSCVNPDHMEPVTRLENIRRGLKGVLRTHCIHGHPYGVPGNLVPSKLKAGIRQCGACQRTPEAISKRKESDRLRYPRFKAQRQARAVARREARSHPCA